MSAAAAGNGATLDIAVQLLIAQARPERAGMRPGECLLISQMIQEQDLIHAPADPPGDAVRGAEALARKGREPVDA